MFFPRAQRVWLSASAVLLLAAVSDSQAQISTPVRPTPDYLNSASFGLSYGSQNDRDADFWGASIDYSRTVGGNWVAAAALTWDSETESFVNRPDTETETYTLLGPTTRPWKTCFGCRAA